MYWCCNFYKYDKSAKEQNDKKNSLRRERQILRIKISES